MLFGSADARNVCHNYIRSRRRMVCVCVDIGKTDFCPLPASFISEIVSTPSVVDSCHGDLTSSFTSVWHPVHGELAFALDCVRVST